MSTTIQSIRYAAGERERLALLRPEWRNEALLHMADALEQNAPSILAANAMDLYAAKGAMSEVMLDRLALNLPRLFAMAEGMRAVAALPDPVGRVLRREVRPNGLVIEKTAVPMGVIAIIYESRPNVTSDAVALAIKAGSACVLRCGKEAHNSCSAIVDALRKGLEDVPPHPCGEGVPPWVGSRVRPHSIQLLEDTSRRSAHELMTARGLVDLLIPRGGAGLIRACVENATVPVIETGTGVCHIYVDKDADLDMALDIVENAKCSRPSVCNAAEVCLVHRGIAAQFLPRLKERLTDRRAAAGLPPVELRLDREAASIIPGTPAGPEDFHTEFLDYIMGVEVVPDAETAAAHIAGRSTGHSEAIVTENEQAARMFIAMVDSAAVYWNASTRFTDGGEFGLGCEMGISTQRLHARGPMGLEELCTYKYVVRGTGQVR